MLHHPGSYRPRGTILDGAPTRISHGVGSRGARLIASALEGDRSLLDGLSRTEARIVADGCRGYDPYDALTSPLFRLPVLRSSKPLRLAAQQTLKRLPVNVRPLLGIGKGYNPVTLALVLEGYAYLGRALPEETDRYREASARLVDELERLASTGYSGACWGYDFDWQTRFDHFPAFTPTIVATCLVTNALVQAHEAFAVEGALALAESAGEFLTHDLNRIPGPADSFCWSYSPLDRQPVLNATAKGARLCAQLAALAGRTELLETAHGSLQFVISHQLPTGAWPYAVDDPRSWSDNFHTGYVLDSLHEYRTRTGDSAFEGAENRGWGYYRDHFFDDGRVPRYYDARRFPVDATAAAQSLLTLCRFGDVETAERVALWSLEHLQRPDGAFAFQVHRRYTNRIPYMRWSTAWMFCGLARLVLARRTTNAA